MHSVRLSLLIILSCFVVVLMVAHAAIADAGASRAIVEYLEEAPVFTTSWGYRDESGVCQIVTVTLTQGEIDPDEDVTEFAARCSQTVRALKAQFPVDATCPQSPPLPQDPPG